MRLSVRAAAPACLPRQRRAMAAMEDPREVRISKALTQILRHTAVELGLAIRPDGFVRVPEVLAFKSFQKLCVTVEDIERCVAESDKQRFELADVEGERMVRAVQGHSMKEVRDEEIMRRMTANDTDLPSECVHGTYKRHVPSFLENGLIAGGKLGSDFRNHVHFAPCAPGHGRVISGMRYDCEVAVWLDLRGALRAGVPFFMAKNQVILSPGIDGVVPAEFIDRVCVIKTGEVLARPRKEAEKARKDAEEKEKAAAIQARKEADTAERNDKKKLKDLKDKLAQLDALKERAWDELTEEDEAQLEGEMDLRAQILELEQKVGDS